MRRISFSEFSSYCKCPLLWDNVYRKKNKVTKPVTYKDLVYKENCESANIVGFEDVCAKAWAIRQYMNEMDSDTILVSGEVFIRDNELISMLKKEEFVYHCDDLEMALPVPEVFYKKNDVKQKIILSTVITSSSGLYKQTPNTLAHFQRLLLQNMSNSGLESLKGCSFNIAIRYIKTASLKMKKAETDEEFEARKAELLKKSKTGTTKAQKQVGESASDFFARYKAAITHSFELENELFLNVDRRLIDMLKRLNMDYDSNNPLPFNDHYCAMCEFNKCGICKNMLGQSDSDLESNGVICVSAK